ncbi:MAG: UbiD family decarboxylase domain-containing protein, partial [Terracidiphilus sp.]
MAYDDLREWIEALEKAGELKRVTAEVSPVLEMTEIADRMSKTGNREQGTGNRKTRAEGKYAPGGPALLFENVKGHPGHKVLMNQFGSERRMAMALGVERLDEIAERISGLMNLKAPEGLLDKLKMLPQLGALASAFPKTVSAKNAACKEVVRRSKDNGGEGLDLNWFPILKCWPLDGGRFITLPCVCTRNPVTGKRNIGIYRMQVYDGQTTGMHWQRQKVAAEHYRELLRRAAVAGAGGTMSQG